MREVGGYYTSLVRTNADKASRKWANIVADTGNDPAAPEPLPSEGAEISSDPAALPAAEKATASEINEGAREAADEPIPAPPLPLHPLAEAIVPMRDDASIRESARHIGPTDPIDPIILFEDQVLDRWELLGGSVNWQSLRVAQRQPKVHFPRQEGSRAGDPGVGQSR